MVVLFSLLSSIVATASPVGDPVVSPVIGRIHLDAQLGKSLVHSVDDGVLDRPAAHGSNEAHSVVSLG
jgi:hypothetical protein